MTILTPIVMLTGIFAAAYHTGSIPLATMVAPAIALSLILVRILWLVLRGTVRRVTA